MKDYDYFPLLMVVVTLMGVYVVIESLMYLYAILRGWL